MVYFFLVAHDSNFRVLICIFRGNFGNKLVTSHAIRVTESVNFDGKINSYYAQVAHVQNSPC